MHTDTIRASARPLDTTRDLDPLLARVGDARIVMIGEASHGTHEYYRWRAALTRRLVAQCGFSFIAVEGDWPDCERVDASLRLHQDAPSDPRTALEQFDRWPTWMWANEEVCELLRWLREVNASRPPRRRCGFHGLDVYSLWESMRAILVHLREHGPDEAEAAIRAYRCFEPYGEDPYAYGAAQRFVPDGCEREVLDLLVALRRRAARGGAREFSAWQHGEVVSGAERYYRAMLRGGPRSWNVRDTHMADTLDRLLRHYGPDAKAVVWAHNTHIGDARATDMAEANMVNIGQLARERYGADSVVLVGFGGHRGSVVAAPAWGAPCEVMPVPPAAGGSVEDALHAAGPARALFVFAPSNRAAWLTRPLGHRAIGVVYDPGRERGNYVPSRLGHRYDAFLWIDDTSALHPIAVAGVSPSEPETYPTGV